MASLIEFAYLCDAVYGANGHYAPHSVPIPLKTSSVTWHHKGHVFRRVSDNAIFAALYSRAGSCPVLVYRGTADKRDAYEDSYIATGKMPPSAMDAINAATQVDKSALYVTGHSLGGALAIIAAGRFGLPAVTFNAPGVANQCMEAASHDRSNQTGASSLNLKDRRQHPLLVAMQRCIGGARLRNIRIQGDAVSARDTELLSKSYQAGRQETYPSPAACNTAGPLTSYISPGTFLLSPTNALAKAAISKTVDSGKDTFCRHQMTTCIQVVSGLPDAYNEVKL